MTVPPPTSAGWQRNGNATQSGTDLVLTTVSPTNQRGSAFWPTPVSSASLNASFDMSIAGGTAGGDGACFVLADPAAGAAALGTAGGGLGFSGIAGKAVCLDTYQNWNAGYTAPLDPSSNFVGLSTGPSGGGLALAATSTAIPAIRTATVTSS